jgi:hypothetical protein
MKSQILLYQVRHDWTPPDGLDHGRPRVVALTRSGKVLVIMAFLLVAGGIAAGVTLGIAASRDARNARILEQQNDVADAVITRKWRSGGDHPQTWISYRFTVSGTSHSQDFKVPLRMWQGLESGSHLPVRFALAQPDLNHPLNLSLDRVPIPVPFLVTSLLVIWSPILLIPIRRQRFLLSEGRPAPGVVTEHKKMQRGSHGEKRGMVYLYDFHVLSGAAGSGSAGPVKSPPAIGSRITVLYDPNDPRRNMPYPIPSPLVRLDYPS